MKTRWLIYILLGVFLSSCYKEENIEGEEDEPKYKVEDSEDPLDHFIYGFYHDYGVFILYDYADDFKKHYFPFKILLADSVQVLKNGVWYPDEPATAGLSFLGIGRIRNGIGEIPADSLFELRGKVQAAFWANFLYNNEMMDLPEAFWNISEDYYGGNLKLVDGNSGLKPDEIDMKKYGFWDRDRTADNGTNYCMAPNKTLDINQFIDMVTTHTTAEMEALIAPYDRLKDKYHLLVNQLKEVYGVDIQAIGNDQY